MYKDKITLHTAKALEATGHITIIDASPESVSALPDGGIAWKGNFKALQEKNRQISPDKLTAFYNAKYSIEVADYSQSDMGVFSWRYLSGIDNGEIVSRNIDNIEYVYVLVNAGYPSLVKIGMTTKQVSGRVTSINATGTVEEWVAKFAVPISKGNAMRVEQAVHLRFSDRRVSSDMGNSREFFTLDPYTAIGAIREIAATHMVGDLNVY